MSSSDFTVQLSLAKWSWPILNFAKKSIQSNPPVDIRPGERGASSRAWISNKNFNIVLKIISKKNIFCWLLLNNNNENEKRLSK